MVDDRCQSLQGSPTCSGCKGRQSGHESHKRGLDSKIHLAVDAHGLPVGIAVTEDTRADCKEAFVAGTTARAAGELIGVQANTAIRFYMRLRHLIASKLPRYELSGEVSRISAAFAKASAVGVGFQSGAVPDST